MSGCSKHARRQSEDREGQAADSRRRRAGLHDGADGLAWCLKNPNVSTVITGASRAEQVHENMKALDVVGQLTPEVLEQIDAILGNRPMVEEP